ncbi:MAG: hypothetical protein J0L92_11585 [Deltaproteobacteria bacterium]|nr:hypothetical protein [Deltaproteobacteria bacterium]
MSHLPVIAPGRTPERSIALATHEGTLIANYTTAPVLALDRRRLNRERAFVERYEKRRNPIAGYNCFGLVFALRRAAIERSSDVELVIKDDGYAPVDPGAEQIGDVVVYDADDGPTHAALVVEIRTLVTLSGGRVPMVLSKFDDVSGEYVHAIENVEWSGIPIVGRRILRCRHAHPSIDLR